MPLGQSDERHDARELGTWSHPDQVLERWGSTAASSLAPDADPGAASTKSRAKLGGAESTPSSLPAQRRGGHPDYDALGWSDRLPRAPRCARWVGSACARSAVLPVPAARRPGVDQGRQRGGARTVADLRVRRMRGRQGGGAGGPSARRRDGSGLEVHADLTMVACGAIHSHYFLRETAWGNIQATRKGTLPIHPWSAVGGVRRGHRHGRSRRAAVFFVEPGHPNKIMLKVAAGLATSWRTCPSRARVLPGA